MTPPPTLLLTKDERERFVEYLTHEVNTTRGIIEQMEKIKSPEMLLRHFRTEAAAYEIVRNKLASVEVETLK